MRASQGVGFCALFVVLFLVSPEPCPGREVTVSVSLQEEIEGQLATGFLYVRAEDNSELNRQVEIDLPWSGQIEAADDIRWLITVEAEGFWAEGVRLGVNEPAAEFAFELLPAGRLSGRLSFPREVREQRELTVTIQGVPDPKRVPVESVHKSVYRCPVDGSSIDCSAPVGDLDVRIEAEGFAPQYFWGISVERDKTHDLGKLDFERGASLTGWIESTTTSQPGLPAAVILQRHVAQDLTRPAEKMRIAARQLEAAVTDRGFFQFTGVEPGGYLLEGSMPGYSSEQVYVEIEPDVENRLDEPVFLERLASIDVFITPPVDVYGVPWMISLLKRSPLSYTFDIVSDEEPASIQGFWENSELTSGDYLLTVSDTRGSRWLDRPLDIYAEMPPVFLEIPLIEIVGHITIGEEPLEATLSFGTTQGTREILFESDSEGRFSGYLPDEGSWPIELVAESRFQVQALEPVEVRKSPGKRIVRLDISLPNTSLSGRVSKDGEPAAGAAVVMLRKKEGDSRREAMLTTDDEGEFSMFGISPGRVLAHAYQHGLKSEWIEVSVSEDLESPPLQLELRDQLEISGAVFAAGRPVPGVAVIGSPHVAGEPTAFYSKAATDVEGNFTLRVSSAATSLDLIIMPAGFAIQIFQVSIQKDQMPPLFIEVAPEGGALVVSSAQNPGPRILRHRGAAVNISSLFSLLAMAGRLRASSEGVGLTNLAPGEYELCHAQNLTVCDRGYLGPSGELVLGRENDRSQ
ncbi:MAG: hypothetical protein GY722_27000 [bacterium]|nr:hypothetical protein [bacterium]